ncbi:MAG: deoxyribose-phosphate aldolase [Candidatus Thorarchaeota archaeon]
MNVNEYLDLACLKPLVTRQQVIETCILGRKHNVASVCVLPQFVSLANWYFDNVSTVIGFPYGCSQAKFSETKIAIADGAKELDVVLDYNKFLSEGFEVLYELVDYAHQNNVIVKLILETCFHTQISLIAACVHYTFVDMLKTSTGVFGGAREQDVLTMLKYSDLPIKASGGIKTKEQAERFIKLGCKRIGASRVF